MIQRSDPTLLIYEGVVQKAIAVISSDPCPAVSVYGLNIDNEPVSLGALETTRIDIPSDSKLVVIWWEYDTSVADYDIVNSIDVLIDGSYGIIANGNGTT